MDWTKAPHFHEVMKKQCEFADVDFNDVDFEYEYWFQDITWTTEQELKFKDWLIDHMYNNIKVRNELMTFPKKSKKYLNKWFLGYNLSYGFRIKND